MNLILLNQSQAQMPRQFIQLWMLLLQKQLGKKLPKMKAQLNQELVVVFLSRPQARQLNKRYRDRNYATDVLSFSSDDGLGELVLCPDVLQKQASEHKLSYREELGYMLLHGVLHLLGFEHEKSPRQAKQMLDLQDEVFDSLREKIHVGSRGNKHVNRSRNLRAQKKSHRS